MTHKIVFTLSFYHDRGAQPLRLLSCYTMGAIKLSWSLLCNLHFSTRSPTVPPPPSLRLKRRKIVKQIWKDRMGLFSLHGSSCFPFCSMVELSWPASEVMQEHLQNLISQGYMTAAELAHCLVPVDPASPTPTGGYVVACATFYGRGFGAPSHRFLHSLLRSYGLELHHLTPSGILHMVAFVTLCEAYIGIKPHFNLWNSFFWAQLRQGSDVEMVALGSVDIMVLFGSEVDP
jgi:hypothetical protein